MAGYTSLEEVVQYGLDDIDEDRAVEMPLRDVLYVYKALGELIRFFGDPSHYPDMDSVAEFVGNTEEGALRVLWDAQHQHLAESFPPDVSSAVEAGELDHPEPPEYGRTAGDEHDDEFDDELDDEDFGAHGFGEETGEDEGGLEGLFDDLDLD